MSRLESSITPVESVERVVVVAEAEISKKKDLRNRTPRKAVQHDDRDEISFTYIHFYAVPVLLQPPGGKASPRNSRHHPGWGWSPGPGTTTPEARDLIAVGLNWCTPNKALVLVRALVVRLLVSNCVRIDTCDRDNPFPGQLLKRICTLLLGRFCDKAEHTVA